MPSADIQLLNAEKDRKYHHEDTIHDVQFNWYGDMMATCSSDHKVKIWEKLEDGSWTVVKEIMAHYSPVWRVSWAHPDYGTILATCSMDHRATIWRMMNDDKLNWVKKELTDSSTPVTDVKFAPRTWSEMMTGSPDQLRLAACSEDKVRLYTVQVNSELNDTYCDCTSENIIDYSEHQGKISCLSWNSSSRFACLVLAVGILGGKGSSRVDLFSFHENTTLTDRSPKKWTKISSIPLLSKIYHLSFRPNNGARDNVLAVATEAQLVVFKIMCTEDIAEEPFPVVEEPVLRPKEDQSQPIKHVSWDMFGRQIIALYASGVVKSYSWKFQPRHQWTSSELVTNLDLTNIPYH